MRTRHGGMSTLGEGGEGRGPFHVTQFRRRVRRNWLSPRAIAKGKAFPNRFPPANPRRDLRKPVPFQKHRKDAKQISCARVDRVDTQNSGGVYGGIGHPPKAELARPTGKTLLEPVPARKRPQAFQGTGSTPNAFESREADFKCRVSASLDISAGLPARRGCAFAVG